MRGISSLILFLIIGFWWLDLFNAIDIESTKKGSLLIITFISFVWYRIEKINEDKQ